MARPPIVRQPGPSVVDEFDQPTPEPVPAGRQLIAEADGGSRGNPGPAAHGALVRDAETREVLNGEGLTLDGSPCPRG